MREVRLDSIAEVRLGRQRSPKNHEGPTMRPYLRAANVGWGGIQLDDVKMMNFTDSEMATYSLEPGDILLGEASGSASEVGKPALWNGEIEDCAFQNTLLRVRSRGAEPRYLLHFFRFQAESGAFAAQSRGVGIHHLGREALASYKIPIPSVDDQRRIAAILDHADALRAQRRAALTLLDELTAAAFLALIKESQGITTTVRDAAEKIQTGPFGSALHKEDYIEGGIPLVNPMHINCGAITPDPSFSVSDAKFKALQSFELQVGDVILARRGEMGRAAVVESRHLPLICGTGSMIIKPNPEIMSGLVLASILGSPSSRTKLLERSLGATLPNLNQSIVGTLEIPAPSLPSQAIFGSSVASIESLKANQYRALLEFDALFASCQDRAFRGEL